jgi:hypothetical protein
MKFDIIDIIREKQNQTDCHSIWKKAHSGSHKKR